MPVEKSAPEQARQSGPPPVDELVVELLQRTEGDPTARESVVDELCRRWPSQERKLRTAVRNLSSAGLIEIDELPDAIGEFRPIRRLGGGGMGVVLLAEQPSLDRNVAIKLLRTDEVLRSGARERFQREIEAVARLAHPNVVSVHSIGRDGAVPFLVMDHVEGASLDRILAAQVGRRPEELTGQDFLTALRAEMAGHGDIPGEVDESMFAGTWNDVCLRVARDVASALAHAHSRGVLHRDVKPSNIMITPGGRVLLVDFGLAAVLDAERITRSGAQMGSLPYLPPEQLSGRADPSPRGDVYSLGVTLFELLMLGLPFPGRGTQRLRADIEEGRMLRVRDANRAVSTDLETVLHCACESEPDRRYASASAFAADLTSVLGGDPIAARPASVIRRFVRWVRRKPELAGLAVLGTLVVVGGPAAYGEIQRRHVAETKELNRQLGVALEKEIEARERADGNYTRAAEAIVNVTGHMAREGLEHEPRMQRARLDIVEDAIRIFAELREDRPDDESAHYHWADLHLTRGNIRTELGQTEGGLADLELQGEALEALLERDPGNVTYIYDLAAGRAQRANVHRNKGDLARTLELFELAGAGLREVQARPSATSHQKQGYAQCLITWSRALMADGDLDGAEALVSEAVPYCRDLADRFPDDVGALYVHAQALRTRAYMHRSRGDIEALANWSGEAIEVGNRLLRLAPGHRHYQLFVVETGHAHVLALTQIGRYDEAAQALDRARSVAFDLERRYPGIYLYHQRHIALLVLETFIAAESGDHERAVELSESAIETHQLYEASEDDSPRVVRTGASLQTNLSGRIAMCVELGDARFPRAEEHAREALRLLGDAPNQELECNAWYNLILALTGQDLVDESIDAAETLSEISVEEPASQRFLADAWCEVQNMCLRTGVDDELARDRALETLERAVALGYRDRRELAATPALDSLRDDPRFQSIMRSLEPDR